MTEAEARKLADRDKHYYPRKLRGHWLVWDENPTTASSSTATRSTPDGGGPVPREGRMTMSKKITYTATFSPRC